ncbi:EpsI family protein [Temperatibacter marinus]|uniref:EpsI family protein n=1 Tax=Temperatibacter marinus TaxID=1456591 RepID=A0AA52HAC6_9PROT|nr:exosortase C-terminal domain/associated protein EpsI [Temperatibacter marinus]WND02600.1 EpsI family protein [Temperatibacter marinus]
MRLGLWPTHLAIAILLMAAMVWAFFPAFIHLWDVLWHHGTYDYALFAPLLTLYLLYQRYTILKDRGRPVPPKIDGLGLLLAVIAILIYTSGQLMSIASLSHISIVLGGWSIALTVIGRRQFQFYFYALACFAFIVPFGFVIVPYLQSISAKGAVTLLSLVAEDLRSDGIFIHMSGGSYLIAKACAGLNFLTTSMMIGYFLSAMLFERFRDKLLVIGLSIVIPIFANILRVVTIILIAEYYSYEFAMSTDHMIYGWIFLSVIMLVLISYAFKKAPKKPFIRLPLRYPAASSWMPVLGLGLLLMLPALLNYKLASARVNNCERPTLHLNVTADWRPLPTSVNLWTPNFVGADLSEKYLFRQADRFVDVRYYYYQYQRDGHELVALRNSIGSSKYRKQNGHDKVFEAIGLTVHEGIVSLGNQERRSNKLVWTIYYKKNEPIVDRIALWKELTIERISGTNSSASVLLLSVSMDKITSEKTIEAARKILRDFLPLVTYSVKGDEQCML